MNDKYINPLTDFGFKKLFGTEPNKELVIDFLNQLLPEEHKIKDLTYTKNEHLGITPLDRNAIFDLFCESDKGDKFIVEIQKAKQNFFKDRSVFYSTFPIQEQAKKGSWNFKLAAVYTVGILDFEFEEDRDDPEIVHTIKLKNQDCKVFFDKLTYIYIELPKFKKQEEELKTRFDKWLYVFKHLSELNNRPRALQERIFQKLFEAAKVANFSREEQVSYRESLKRYWDLNNVIDTAREEGKEEGKEEGREEGKSMGKKEEKIAIAKKLKLQDFDIQMISEVTGLSKREIDEL